MLVASALAMVAAAPPTAAGRLGGAMVALDLESGEERWRAGLASGRFFVHPMVGGPRIYATDLECSTGAGSQVVALDARTGDEVWRSETEMRLVNGSIGQGIVLATDAAGAVHGLDARTGADRWTVSTGGSVVVGTPTLLIVSPVAAPVDGSSATETTGIRAFDRRTGEPHWTLEPDEPPTGTSVVAADDGLVALSLIVANPPTLATELIVVDAESGAERFRERFAGDRLIAPITMDLVGSVLVGADARQLVGRDVESGKVRWRVEDEDAQAAVTSPEDDVAYLSDIEPPYELVAIDADTGDRRWVKHMPTGTLGGAGRGIVVIWGEGDVRGLDADSGVRRWRVPRPEGLEHPIDVAGFGRGSVFLNTGCDA